MPVETYREEPGIYVSRWIGSISIPEMLREVKKGPQLADEDDYYKYVYVLDVSELGNIPFDVNNMRRVAEETSDRHYNIIVGASYGVHLLTKIVSRFTDYEVRFADDMDECLKMAREFLAQMEKE